MDEIRYPEIVVDLGDLDGPEGNAFAIIGKGIQALKGACRSGLIEKEHIEAIVEEYNDEAMSGDYDNLLAVTARWFVCG